MPETDRNVITNASLEMKERKLPLLTHTGEAYSSEITIQNYTVNVLLYLKGKKVPTCRWVGHATDTTSRCGD